MGSDTDVAEKLPKLYGSKSGQKSILAKYLAIASTSTVTSETIQDPSGVTPLGSESAGSASTPSVVTNPVTNTGLAIPSDVTPSLSAAKSKTVGAQTSVIPVVSEGGAIASTPSVVPKPCTSQVVTCASHASHTEDFDLQQPSAIKSPSNVSDNTTSGLVITNVRSISEISSSEVPNPSKSGRMSAEDLPPLELKKCLHVSIERYPNLLKRFEEGKVRIRKERGQDVRLTAIKSKKVTPEVFGKFYTDQKEYEQSGRNYVPVKFPEESESSSESSEEGDDTEDD